MLNMIDQSLLCEEEIIHFNEGIFGFEDKKEFVAFPINEENTDVLNLCSIEDEDVAFVLMNPFALMDSYNPILSNEDKERLNVKDEGNLSYYLVCVVKETIGESTVNLKCPIVVNTENMQAIQVMLDTQEYQFRHMLKDIQRKGA